eukprot:359266-Prorocentrum_minimum.AAC.1
MFLFALEAVMGSKQTLGLELRTGLHRGEMLSGIVGQVRLVPAMGMFSPPFCDWCPLWVYSLPPSAIGARYGYILDLPRVGLHRGEMLSGIVGQVIIRPERRSIRPAQASIHLKR